MIVRVLISCVEMIVHESDHVFCTHCQLYCCVILRLSLLSNPDFKLICFLLLSAKYSTYPEFILIYV